jgi:superfamily II DNA or RNA helicase
MKKEEVRIIYVYSIPGLETHQGLLKIGQAHVDKEWYEAVKDHVDTLTQNDIDRIKDQLNTSGVAAKIEHIEDAIDNKYDKFSDHDVHNILKRSGYNKHKFETSNAQEWFKIDINTVKEAITAVKKGREFILTEKNAVSPDILRPCQRACLSKMSNAYKEGIDKFLMNAKMRFGKTFVTLYFIKNNNFDKVLILTHRPTVESGWRSDFQTIFGADTEYKFRVKSDKNNKDCDKIVYFASIQDLRGQEGRKASNKWVLSTTWDLVIVDEAHEGTQTETWQEVRPKIKRNFTLELSGTPFNIIEDYTRETMFTWDYVDEQRAKHDWKDVWGANPYKDLPQMQIYTYNMTSAHKFNKDNYFDFKEFFAVENNKFTHEDDVKDFLKMITEDQDIEMPFASSEKKKLNAHSLWVLPSVAACEAMETLICNCRGFDGYETINIAGDNATGSDSLDKVLDAIKEHNRTITLSCGRLTTGSTVKEWSCVLMLRGGESTSASSYMQTIFRCQSPFKGKETCQVYDFSPSRTLKILCRMTGIKRGGNTTEQHQIEDFEDLLEFMPIYQVNSGIVGRVATENVMQQIKNEIYRKLADNGFSTDEMFNENYIKKQFGSTKQWMLDFAKKAKTNIKGQITINKSNLNAKQVRIVNKKESGQKLTATEEAELEKIKEEAKKIAEFKAFLKAAITKLPAIIFSYSKNTSDKDFELKTIIENIDDPSWEEFFPKELTKSIFINDVLPAIDQVIFTGACKEIVRRKAEADKLDPFNAIIARLKIVNTFRNPDNEKVLTPISVCNRHVYDILGGIKLFDNYWDHQLEHPESKSNEVSEEVYHKDSKILCMMSKSGVYPAFMILNLLSRQLTGYEERHEQMAILKHIIENNIYVVCGTKMAERITKQLIAGFEEYNFNFQTIEGINKTIKDYEKLSKVKKVIKHKEILKDFNPWEVEFDLIIGNPPYQDEGMNPLYHLFIDFSKNIKPKNISMIVPSRWMSGGGVPTIFRKEMLDDKRIKNLYDISNSKEIFPTVDIKGGICYFLWNKYYNQKCMYTYCHLNKSESSYKYLNEFNGIIFKNEICKNISNKIKSNKNIDNILSSAGPYGFNTNFKGRDIKTEKDCIKLYGRINGKRSFTWISNNEILKYKETINNWKVGIAEAYGVGSKNSDPGMSEPLLIEPNAICTQTFLVSVFNSKKEAENFITHIKTKTFRYLISILKTTQHASRKVYSLIPVEDYSKPWTDKELYKKYNLSDEEINEIETKIKVMA